ncbi:MAG: hypothetical protein K2X94_04105 [Amoebophilaceae bacterium]|nr:hypothetical protein [Amoebophilaceae bacterium]
MKKINLLAVVVAGVFAVACNGGSSSGGSSTPEPTPTPTPTVTPTPTPTPSDDCSNGAATCGAPAAPVAYNQLIQSGGSLLSTTGLYVSTGSTDVPLPFEVSNITQDVVVTFTVAQSSASTNKLQANALPVLSSNSCTFNVASPEACNLNVNFAGASNGVYTITPSIGGQAMPPITITSMAASSFTLPLGTYVLAGKLLEVGSSAGVIDRCGIWDIPNGWIFVNTLTGGYVCLDNECAHASGIIVAQNRYPTVTLPSDAVNETAYTQSYTTYLSNGGWNNNVFTQTQSNSLAQCNGLFATSTMTFQSSSTTPPYPVVNQTTLKTKSTDKTMTSLLGGIAQ